MTCMISHYLHHGLRLFSVFASPWVDDIHQLVEDREGEWSRTWGDITYTGSALNGVLSMTRWERGPNNSLRDTHSFSSDDTSTILNVLPHPDGHDVFSLEEVNGDIRLIGENYPTYTPLIVLGWKFNVIDGECLDGPSGKQGSKLSHPLVEHLEYFPRGLKNDQRVIAFMADTHEGQRYLLGNNGVVIPVETGDKPNIPHGGIFIDETGIHTPEGGRVFYKQLYIHYRTGAGLVTEVDLITHDGVILRGIHGYICGRFFTNFLKNNNSLFPNPMRVVFHLKDDTPIRYFWKGRDITDFYTTQFGDRVDLTEDELFILNMA